MHSRGTPAFDVLVAARTDQHDLTELLPHRHPAKHGGGQGRRRLVPIEGRLEPRASGHVGGGRGSRRCRRAGAAARHGGGPAGQVHRGPCSSPPGPPGAAKTTSTATTTRRRLRRRPSAATDARSRRSAALSGDPLTAADQHSDDRRRSWVRPGAPADRRRGRRPVATGPSRPTRYRSPPLPRHLARCSRAAGHCRVPHPLVDQFTRVCQDWARRTTTGEGERRPGPVQGDDHHVRLGIRNPPDPLPEPRPTRPRGPGPFPSTRPPATPSATPPTRPPSSGWRSSATSTPGS